MCAGYPAIPAFPHHSKPIKSSFVAKTFDMMTCHPADSPFVEDVNVAYFSCLQVAGDTWFEGLDDGLRMWSVD